MSWLPWVPAMLVALIVLSAPCGARRMADVVDRLNPPAPEREFRRRDSTYESTAVPPAAEREFRRRESTYASTAIPPAAEREFRRMESTYESTAELAPAAALLITYAAASAARCIEPVPEVVERSAKPCVAQRLTSGGRLETLRGF